ncbi:MAG: hypothetical protein ABIG10_01620 [bacterium]
MDILSHALLANLVYKELPMHSKWIAVTLAVMPDILTFVGVFKLEFFKKLLFFKKIPNSYFPKFVFVIYNITHSILIWAVIWLFFYFVMHWTLTAIIWSSWGLHIFIDIFTHNANSSLATRIFWPVSDWHFYGFTWSSKRFMLVNYLILAILYLIFYL